MKLFVGDCREVMDSKGADTIDAIVTDPPYELGFMNRPWDQRGVSFDSETWKSCLRVLKPGGHMLVFGGTRTFHRIAVAIEDAGFEIRDTIMWLYGSGFPKSHNVSKAIDKSAGAEREVIGSWEPTGTARIKGNGNSGHGYDHGELRNSLPITSHATDEAKRWDGWGTALKPAFEPIIVARKPLIGTVVQNVLTHGTGAINIDAARVPHNEACRPMKAQDVSKRGDRIIRQAIRDKDTLELKPEGRWPANVIFDEEAAALLDDQTSGASRFFYCAKASRHERGPENNHPTVKPITLMRYLVRLVTPPRGMVLDPFMGSGSTGVAAVLEGFNFTGIDLTPEYISIAQQRIDHVLEQVDNLATR
jgi:DNA modification methylase